MPGTYDVPLERPDVGADNSCISSHNHSTRFDPVKDLRVLLLGRPMQKSSVLSQPLFVITISLFIQSLQTAEAFLLCFAQSSDKNLSSSICSHSERPFTSLLPARSPATTKSVFLLTLSEVSPPRLRNLHRCLRPRHRRELSCEANLAPPRKILIGEGGPFGLHVYPCLPQPLYHRALWGSEKNTLSDSL